MLRNIKDDEKNFFIFLWEWEYTYRSSRPVGKIVKCEGDFTSLGTKPVSVSGASARQITAILFPQYCKINH
jgi:hypothetical protein